MSLTSDGRLVDSSGSGQPSQMMQLVMGRMINFLQERANQNPSSTHTDPPADDLQESQPGEVLEESQPDPIIQESQPDSFLEESQPEEERQYQILDFGSPIIDPVEVSDGENTKEDEVDSEMGQTVDAAAKAAKADEKKKKKQQKKKEKKLAKTSAAK